MPWLWSRSSTAPFANPLAADQGRAGHQSARHNVLMSLWCISLCSVPLIALAVVLPILPASASWKGVKDVFEYAIVAGFSALVADGEIVSRYKDDPLRLLGAGPTRAYVLVNIVAGIAALVVVRYTGVLKNMQS